MQEPPPSTKSETETRREAQDGVILDALARGLPYREAGEMAGVSARTVRRRMSEEDFAQEVRSRRSERVSALTGQLVTGSEQAVGTLVECLAAEKQADRIRASSALLHYSERYRAQSDLQAEMAEIRRMLEHNPSSETGSGDSHPS
jgi:hypothetical protein